MPVGTLISKYIYSQFWRNITILLSVLAFVTDLVFNSQYDSRMALVYVVIIGKPHSSVEHLIVSD